MKIFKYTLLILIGLSLLAFLVYPDSQNKLTVQRLLEVIENAPTGIYERVTEYINSLEPPQIENPSGRALLAPPFKIPPKVVSESIDGINTLIRLVWGLGEATIFATLLLYECIHMLAYLLTSLV